MTIRSGRFGTYLQLGESKSKEEKPKRSSIPKGVDPNDVDLDYALKLLALPREIGPHPETGSMILAGLGRYGPYVQHEKVYANVQSIEDVFNIGLNRAVTVLAEKAANKGARFGRGAAQRTVLKDLGDHPDGNGRIEVLDGRYGPYITHNGVNANVPRGKDPAEVSVEEAVALLAERAAKGGGKKAKPRPAAKATRAKPAAANDDDVVPKKKPAARKKAVKAPPDKDAAE